MKQIEREALLEASSNVISELQQKPCWRITFETFPSETVYSDGYDRSVLVEQIADAQQTMCITVFGNEWKEFIIAVASPSRKLKALERIARALVSADTEEYTPPPIITALRWAESAGWDLRFSVNGKPIEAERSVFAAFIDAAKDASEAIIEVRNRVGGLDKFTIRKDGEYTDELDEFEMSAFIEKNKVFRAQQRREKLARESANANTI